MKKRTIFLISLLFALFINGSCRYDFIIPPEAPTIRPDVTVSFASQVSPIFSAGTKCTSCHKSGGQAPDLTSASAFASIVPALVNTASPDQSLIYTFPAPTTSIHSWKKYSASEAAILLAWIQQGAKNN